MSTREIIYLVALAAIVIYAIVVTSFNVIRKKKTKKAQTDTGVVEPVEDKSFFEQVFEKVLDTVDLVEDKYKKLGVSSAGSFKLDDALTKIRSYCNDKGITFDEEQVTNLINKIVKVGNDVGGKKLSVNDIAKKTVSNL